MPDSSPFLLAADSATLLTCERLPTPVQFDSQSISGSLLSPPLSRAASPLPALLFINADATSNPKIISPLPSPILDPKAPQVGKKTSAFFGSPFNSRPPTPPPAVERRASSFITSSSSSVSSSEHEHLVSEPQRSQTANSSFFAKGSATPTPPPSTYSCADDDPPADSVRKLPPLARFFPSRATIDPDPNLFDSPGRLSPPAVQTSFHRDFVNIDDSTPFPSSPTELVTPDSPTPKSEAPSPSFPPPLPQPLHRETLVSDPTQPAEGSTVGDDVPLTLVRELGKGAFSCVWLAIDKEHKLEQSSGVSRLSSQSCARKRGDRSVHGLRPSAPHLSSGSLPLRSESIFLAEQHEECTTGLLPPMLEAAHENRNGGKLVAVKMMDRAMCDANDRTRISFVREVEVLRHISHPSIVSYLHSFTTPTHHCLVLEALQGGELFELLDQGDNHSRMTEPLLRRIFGELCQAVGWMHGVGLVHRDLKLENILLTANPFLTPAASPISLASLPAPLVKLTDFGLARFIDPAAPELVTRCGSESYAAPEIVTGRPYDGRQTDAWACGVVLYALATRALPFDRVGSDRDTRRSYLMRIAQGEYSWPEPGARLATEGLKRVVARLLVRNPAKRARVVALWDEGWMWGEGSPPRPASKTGSVPPDSTGRLVGEDIPSVAKQEL